MTIMFKILVQEKAKQKLHLGATEIAQWLRELAP